MIISDKIPHDVGAERACLGAVLMSPDTLWDLQAQGVVPESFYSEPHRLIWRTYLECSQADEAMDPVGRFEERMLALDRFRDMFLALYDRFLDERLDPERWTATRDAIREWVAGR